MSIYHLKKEVNAFLSSGDLFKPDLIERFKTTSRKKDVTSRNLCDFIVIENLRFLNNLYRAKSYHTLNEDFICESFKAIIKKEWKSGEFLTEEEIKSITFSRINELTDFLYGKTNQAHKKRLDYLSILVQGVGFNAYKCEGEIRSLKKSPLEEDNHRAKALKDFFSTNCYLYVYDEDIVHDSKKEKYLYPRIDALVLRLSNNQFNVYNVEGKSNYEEGKIEWCNEYKNSFNLIFENSERNLYFRFHFPQTLINQKKKSDLLLGKFLISIDAKGRVVAGSVILKKHEEQIKPYKYYYRNNLSKNLIPPHPVRRYLSDRYLNWHKAPYDVSTFKGFEEWVEKKYQKDYTKLKLTINDFLVCYPISSFEEEKYLEILNSSIKKVISHIELTDAFDKKNISWSTALKKKKAIKKMNHSLARMERDKSLKIFPIDNESFTIEDPSGNGTAINRELLNNINQSINVLIILPDVKYKNASSIFTLAGYSIALKKRTFIAYQNGNMLPKILQKDSEQLDLYLVRYHHISEIPFLVRRKMFLSKESESQKS